MSGFTPSRDPQNDRCGDARERSPRIQPGQIWLEVDPRFARFVRVEVLVGGTINTVGIRTVVADAGVWRDAPRSRLSFARPERFNGKRGNYVLHEGASDGAPTRQDGPVSDPGMNTQSEVKP